MSNRGVIDIGNTRIKAGIFSNVGELIETNDFKDIADIIIWLEKKDIHDVIVSDVKGQGHLLKHSFKVTTLDTHLKLPFSNLYQTPETLGADRIAAMSAVSYLFPGQASLVFDIGTCITIDLLNPENQYYGGNISPGINMRLNAMHQYTNKLPLSSIEFSNFSMGTDTFSALANGAVTGILHEIEGYIQHTLASFPELNIVLCGGDAHYFDKQLKYKIFANQNLVLYGLYHLLVFND